MINHYFALLDERGVCIATLPAPQHGTTVDKDGTIGGQTGAMDLWNGPPKPWCHQIVEVRSPEPWYKVTSDQKTIIWRRPMKRFVIYHKDHGIYLGNAMGLGFWSKLDPVGQDHAVTFETERAAQNHISSWDTQLEGCEVKPVEIEVNLDSEFYASIDNCVAAGLPAWDPNKKGEAHAEASEE